MLFTDTYRTITQASEGIFKDRGSKFLGFAYPLANESELKELIGKLKSEHAKARHFCWAFRLGQDRSIFRINDDGEPSGTAGKPILNILLSKDLTNILVVVVRYFGGTLLGVPGLINAYKTAAQEAVMNATIIEKTVNDLYRLTFGYRAVNDVMKIIKDENLLIANEVFDNECSMVVSVRKADLNLVLNKLEKVESVILTYLGTNQ